MPREAVPEAEIARFKAMVGDVLQNDYVPKDWESADLHGLTPCEVKPLAEVNGIATTAEYEVDCSRRPDELRVEDAIHGAWAAGGVQLIPLWRRASDPEAVFIRFRLFGKERLFVKPRPDQFSRGPLADNLEDFFDKPAFYSLFVKLLRAPFAEAAELVGQGSDSTYDGVRVFSGLIRSREWTTNRDPHALRQVPPHWWDEMQILVTDSDPQYFCVSIVFREQDKLRRQ
ncbi:MAG: hypothetical protein HY763_09960 [Planctomycetes bacterium]|nr:hypothetical protein [Planctomycetota bacterium]